jgi:flagellin
MRGQIGGLNQAIRNAQDGISLIQTAEGALTETHSMLNRMRELTVQALNGTNTSADVGQIRKEMDQLAEELTRIANNTEFNTKVLLSGGFETTGLTFHIGANSGENLELKISSMRADKIGSSGANTISSLKVSGADVSKTTGVITQSGADKAIKIIDDAINDVSSERAKLGATQNRLEHTINNLTTTSENLSAAEARIRDVDMAQEMMEFTRTNILTQAATAMLAQANQMPNSVLQLLQ